jgi:hypothetical protein
VSQADTHAADQRRSRLLDIKLRALVAGHLGIEEIAQPDAFAPGAALIHDGEAWVLVDDRPGDRLGVALIWATRAAAGSLNVIVDADSAGAAATLARQAGAFTMPITVWSATGRSLRRAQAAPLPVSQAASAAHEELRELIVAGGATPLVEHGVLFGEVRGLEVCRVVDDPHLRTVRLEVGVGAHDREAFQMMHGDVPTVESLARIVRVVELHRDIDASPHPLKRLAAERFIRWRIEQRPAAIGAIRIEPVAPPVPRPNLKDPTPCVAVGCDADDRALTVVCASGVDLNLVPFATDARLATAAVEPGGSEAGRLVVVTPTRDRVAVIDELASLLRQPLELMSID